jgi:transposase
VRLPALLSCAGATTSLPVSFTPGKSNIASGQLYTWKKQYADGKLDPEPSKEAELEARVRELERLLGKVTLENEFLKKAVRNSLKQAEKKQSSLPKTAPSSKALKGGAN